MDQQFQAILDAFEHYPPTGADWSFISMFVVPNITPANVKAVLKFLASHAELNGSFWATVNRAPSSDDDWKAMRFFGSNMHDEELQERHRQRLRSAVDIVRNELGSVQLRRDGLFRPRR